MTDVLLIVTPDYPDMEAVSKRMLRGSTREGVTAWRRKYDGVVKGIAEVLGIEVKVAPTEYGFTGDGYHSELLNRMDLVVVYGTPKSTVSDFWIEKASKYPYNLIFGSKIELNIAEAGAKHLQKVAAAAAAEGEVLDDGEAQAEGGV